MNFQDFRNLQKAYKQVYSSQRLNEFGPIDGGSLAVKRTFGGAPGTKQNTTVSGSASLGGSNVSGSLEQGKFSGQGDNTSQGVTNALNNLENPNSKLNTSTSTSTTGVRGTLNANISGKIGSGQKQTMLTAAPATPPAPAPAPAPATPPATKLPQEPAPKTPVAKTPVAILNNPKPPPTPTKLISVAKNMEAIRLAQEPAPAPAQKPAPAPTTQSRLRGFM